MNVPPTTPGHSRSRRVGTAEWPLTGEVAKHVARGPCTATGGFIGEGGHPAHTADLTARQIQPPIPDSFNRDALPGGGIG